MVEQILRESADPLPLPSTEGGHSWQNPSTNVTDIASNPIQNTSRESGDIEDIAARVRKLSCAQDVFKSGACVNLDDVDFSGKTILHHFANNMRKARRSSSRQKQESILHCLQLVLDLGGYPVFRRQILNCLVILGGRYKATPVDILMYEMEGQGDEYTN